MTEPARKRRVDSRVEKIQLVQISRFDEEGFRADLATGRTINISKGGLRLELHHPLPLRSQVELDLALGDELTHVSGTVVYLEVIDSLELPPGALPLFGLCVGYPAQDPKLKPRLPLAAVLLEERYPTDAEVLAQVAEHDSVMADYYRDRGKDGHDWSGAIWRRYSKPRREHLVECYRGLGARLD